MAKVQTGELRDMIDVFQGKKLKEKGITTYEYKFISYLRCKVKHDKNKFFYSNDTRKNSNSLIFICYDRDFLHKEDMFVQYKDKYYRITEIVPFEDYMFCQVYAEKVE